MTLPPNKKYKKEEEEKISKFIIVTQDYSGLGFAKILQDEGADVILATKPKEDEDNLEAFEIVGNGIVDKEDLDYLFKNREKYKDCLWWFDQNHNYEIADTLRKEGFYVLGGHELTYKMEHDRDFGIDLIKKAGLVSPPSFEFDTAEEGMEFLDKNYDTAYVCKPDEPNEKEWVTTCPENDNNIKANREIYNYLRAMGNRGKYILQERKQGVEINVEFLMYKGKPVLAHANFEAKKKDAEDQGKSIGCAFDIDFIIPINSKILKDTLWKLIDLPEFRDYTGRLDGNFIVADNEYWFLEFCFDDKTEILTKDGWKLIKDVPIGTEVATLNRETHELEYQKTTDLIIQDYKGEMIKLGGEHTSIDALATPNHHFYVQKFDRKTNTLSEFQDVEGKDLKPGMVIKRDAKWIGKEEEFYIIPEYVEKHYNGRHKKYFDIIHPAKKVKMDDWLQFLAFYLSEGSQSKKNYVVQISQKNHRDEIEKVLKRLPFKYMKDDKGFRIASVQLASHLSGFGTCSEKYVPQYVKELSSRQIRIFLDAYALGDGTRHKKNGQVSYITTSKKMADDLQELILKAGSFANIRIDKTAGTVMKIRGKEYIRKHDRFTVSERRVRNSLWLTKRHIKREYYEGKVYCVTVPNHTIYVRRNGKAFWSANCAREGYNSSPNQFINLAISPLSEILSDWLTGKPIEHHFRKGYGASITLWIDNPVTGLPITFDNEEVESKFYHFDTYYDDGYFTAGYSNEVGIICAHDYDLKSAAEEVVRRYHKIHYSNKTGRLDIDKTNYKSNPIQRDIACRSMGLFDKI